MPVMLRILTRKKLFGGRGGDVLNTAIENVSTTKKTVVEGPTTTTKVTTRVTTQQQVAKKPLSPFAKFRQLDKQNSLNTPRFIKTI
ncbi:hypothetical protein NQ315_001786 [Exocentrus adspersus]|uniref:Uncharacterized protein n=1 Tax=Exocentrus adspersus TaxID=1586481 RepID=A0AAV8W9B2_9CUCU|nr:hypothetical protein NQ315_001786 [Exocentrus adspersus]